MGMLRKLAGGAAAGAVGTLAMDAVWYRRYRHDGGEQGFAEWELAASAETFEDAGAPAKLGRRVAGALGIELPDDAAATVTNVVHWATGIGYGALLHAVIDRRHNVAASALAAGVGAFANSYAVLGALGIYQPLWEYDADTLRDDLTAHLAYGAATALTYRVLTASRRRPGGGR